MSWSINAVGSAEKVRAAVAAQVASIKCSEPEESIKNGVGAAIDAALAAMPGDTAVNVQASGSQTTQGGTNEPQRAVNSLHVEVKPIWGFQH